MAPDGARNLVIAGTAIFAASVLIFQSLGNYIAAATMAIYLIAFAVSGATLIKHRHEYARLLNGETVSDMKPSGAAVWVFLLAAILAPSIALLDLHR